MKHEFYRNEALRHKVKFGLSEKGTKFQKIFHLKFDVTQQRQILSGRFFQILCPSQKVRTLQIMVTLFMDDPLNQERHAVGGHYFVKCFIKGLQNGTSLYTTDTYYEWCSSRAKINNE